jgi:hypothetical protein
MYSEYTKQQIQAFFDHYGPAIIEGITDSGLFFPAVIAQLSMESKWGTSSPGNNFAGIKATGSIFSSGSQSLDTTEYIGGKRVPVKQKFATYADFSLFMKDYVRVLKLDRYVNAGVYLAQNPYDQILAIAKGGYSTADPKRYLNDCRGRIDAALDIYKFGKISSTVSEPTVVDNQAAGGAGTLAGSLATINGAIANSLSNVLKKP